jgi:hypothetical protein
MNSPHGKLAGLVGPGSRHWRQWAAALCLLACAVPSSLRAAPNTHFHPHATAEELRAGIEQAGTPTGLEAGPTRATYTHLSDAEFALLLKFWNESGAIRRFYSNVTMRGRMERQLVRKGDAIDDRTPRETATFSYYSTGGRDYRLDLRGTNRGGEQYSVVGVVSPEEQTLLQSDLQTDKLFLKGNIQNRDLALQQFCRYSPHHLAFTVPYELADVPLFQAIFFPQSYPLVGTVTSVATVTDEAGEQVVRIVWSSTNVAGLQKTFDLLPDRLWALKLYSREALWSPGNDTKPGSSATAGYALRDSIRCAYSGGPTDPPLLKSYELTFAYVDSPDPAALKTYQSEVVQVDEITLKPAPASAFDVNALLGRTVKFSPEARDRYWWVLVLNGLALFLIGGFFLRRSAKERRAKQASETPKPPGG